MSVRDLEIKGKLNKFRLGKFSFAKKKSKLTGIHFNKRNCSHEQKHTLRKLFLDTNTKRAFHLRGSYKKAWTAHFSGKVVKSGRVGLPISLSIIFYLTSCGVNCTELNFQTCYLSRTKDCKKNFNSNTSVHRQIRR